MPDINNYSVNLVGTVMTLQYQILSEGDASVAVDRTGVNGFACDLSALIPSWLPEENVADYLSNIVDWVSNNVQNQDVALNAPW